MRNCVDIVRPFVEDVRGEGLPIQVMGGIGSAALSHPEVVIIPDEKRIVAPSDLNLPQYRDDWLNTKRDLDVLVMSTDQPKVKKAETIGKETVGDDLDLSFFGLRTWTQLEGQRSNTASILWNSAKRVLGDRYALEEDGEVVKVRKALFPFAVDVDLETLETWHLFIGDNDRCPTPVPHPGTVIANYVSRSVGGLRPKDAKKIGKVADNIFTKRPELKEWVLDGPAQSQIELARIIASLRRIPGTPLGGLKVGQSINLPPYRGEIAGHESFMVPYILPSVIAASIAAKRFEAPVMRGFEYCGPLVALWQKYVEPHIAGIIKNE